MTTSCSVEKNTMNCEIVVTFSDLKHSAQNPNLMLNWRASLQMVAEEPEAEEAWRLEAVCLQRPVDKLLSTQRGK